MTPGEQKIPEPQRVALVRLCDGVLAANLFWVDFEEGWPQGLDEEPLRSGLQEFRDSTQSAWEHRPAGMTYWQSSGDYALISLYRKVLEGDPTLDQLTAVGRRGDWRLKLDQVDETAQLILSGQSDGRRPKSERNWLERLIANIRGGGE